MSRTIEINRREFLVVTLAGVLAMAGPASAGSCRPTEDNPEGPFYIPDAPFRNRLAPDSLAGERLRISGRVLGSPGCKPLAGAVVDVWHAGPAGFYYGLEASRPLKPEEYLLRGRIRTGEDGRYAFDTVLPGRYQVSETWVRPRHIHYSVSHPARSRLITQLYFEGDPYNPTDRLLKPSLIRPLESEKGDGDATRYEGTFDITLGPA